MHHLALGFQRVHSRHSISEEQLKAINHLNSQLADPLAEVRHQKPRSQRGQNNEEEEKAQSLRSNPRLQPSFLRLSAMIS
jgi:hypothetical protein